MYVLKAFAFWDSLAADRKINQLSGPDPDLSIWQFVVDDIMSYVKNCH